MAVSTTASMSSRAAARLLATVRPRARPDSAPTGSRSLRSGQPRSSARAAPRSRRTPTSWSSRTAGSAWSSSSMPTRLSSAGCPRELPISRSTSCGSRSARARWGRPRRSAPCTSWSTPCCSPWPPCSAFHALRARTWRQRLAGGRHRRWLVGRTIAADLALPIAVLLVLPIWIGSTGSSPAGDVAAGWRFALWTLPDLAIAVLVLSTGALAIGAAKGLTVLAARSVGAAPRAG